MKIKYEHDGISLLTKCPHGMNPKVGGTGCSNCDHFGDWIGGNTILCNYKEEEVKHINGPWKVTSDKSIVKVIGFDSCGQEIIPKSNKTPLSIYTNRHTTTDGDLWGWIEGCTKNICWQNNGRFTKEDASILITNWNKKIKEAQSE